MGVDYSQSGAKALKNRFGYIPKIGRKCPKPCVTAAKPLQKRCKTDDQTATKPTIMPAPTNTPPVKPQEQTKSKAEMAQSFGVSGKVFMRWVNQWNKKLVTAGQEPIDVRGQYFTPRDARRLREQFS